MRVNIFVIFFPQEQSGQANRAQLFVKFLEAVVEVYGIPTTDQKTQRSGSVASVKPILLSSSTEDLRVASSGSSLSSSLSSLSGAAPGKHLFIPLPFKRSSSSYRAKKADKESPKFRRNWSTRGTRSPSSGKVTKWQGSQKSVGVAQAKLQDKLSLLPRETSHRQSSSCNKYQTKWTTTVMGNLKVGVRL